MKFYVVKYTGPFGFIKPWTAVRDELTFSQTFLSPATIKGISQKLFGIGEMNRIKRYKLQFSLISEQQEQAWAPLRKFSRKRGVKSPNNSVITRGVLLDPKLYVAFSNQEDAKQAMEQHVCLCRNEDILLPDNSYGIEKKSEPNFDDLEGFELLPTDSTKGFPAGRDRYLEGAPMTYGKLLVKGQ